MTEKTTSYSYSNTSNAIPVIDLKPWWSSFGDDDEAARHAVAQAVAHACEHVGFFSIVNHGVDETIINACWEASAEFFDLPLDLKLQAKSPNQAEYPYGYENTEVLSVGKQRDQRKQDNILAAAAAPDLKETFSIGPSNPASGMPGRQWPEIASPDFEPALTAYFQAMEGLAANLLQIFAMALSLPKNFFEAHMDHHSSALRTLNYFPIRRHQLQTGQLRASAHTDYGALTILKSGGPGLQVKQDTDSSEWVDVPTIPDAFIINLGDMMRRWTNEKWLSTLHRVIVTEEDAKRRQSIAYFGNINGDSMVDPRDLHPNEIPKYPPISAKEHLMAKHLASMGVAVDSSS